MRRKYEKPNMNLEMFEANEYIAACYNVTCNVGGGLDNYGVAYYEGNNKIGYQSDGDNKISGGNGCDHTHTLKEKDLVYTGALWDATPNIPGNNPYEIIVWKDKRNTHFTKFGSWTSNGNHS